MQTKNKPVELAIKALEKWKQQLAFDANVGRTPGAPEGMRKRAELYDQLAEAIVYQRKMMNEPPPPTPTLPKGREIEVKG